MREDISRASDSIHGIQASPDHYDQEKREERREKSEERREKREEKREKREERRKKRAEMRSPEVP